LKPTEVAVNFSVAFHGCEAQSFPKLSREVGETTLKSLVPLNPCPGRSDTREHRGKLQPQPTAFSGLCRGLVQCRCAGLASMLSDYKPETPVTTPVKFTTNKHPVVEPKHAVLWGCCR